MKYLLSRYYEEAIVLRIWEQTVLTQILLSSMGPGVARAQLNDSHCVFLEHIQSSGGAVLLKAVLVMANI